TCALPIYSIRLRDPIDNRPDPELARFLCGSATVATCPKPKVAGGSSGFLNTTHFTPLTVLSARELRLIVAEAALAAGNTAGFQVAIDSLRALDGLRSEERRVGKGWRAGWWAC